MYPKILITSFKIPTEKMGEAYSLDGVEFSLVTQDYSESLSKAGAIPLIMPYLESRSKDEQYIKEVLEEVDGLSPTPRDIFAELQKNEREINYANFQEEFQETFDILIHNNIHRQPDHLHPSRSCNWIAHKPFYPSGYRLLILNS